MNISVTITKAFDLQTGEGRNGQWQKKTYLATYGGNYPKEFAFDVFNANIDKLRDILIPGKIVNLNIDIESREYNGRYYTNVTAWGATSSEDAPVRAPEATQGTSTQPAAPSFIQEDETLDLPF